MKAFHLTTLLRTLRAMRAIFRKKEKMEYVTEDGDPTIVDFLKNNGGNLPKAMKAYYDAIGRPVPKKHQTWLESHSSEHSNQTDSDNTSTTSE
jgi:hypothetical protein